MQLINKRWYNRKVMPKINNTLSDALANTYQCHESTSLKQYLITSEIFLVSIIMSTKCMYFIGTHNSKL